MRCGPQSDAMLTHLAVRAHVKIGVHVGREEGPRLVQERQDLRQFRLDAWPERPCGTECLLDMFLLPFLVENVRMFKL